MLSAEEILVLIPAYNEERMIATVIKKLRNEGLPWIVVINDGSTDSTKQLALEAGAKVISHPINRGSGAATKTGFQYALKIKAKVVVTIDADDQHDPSDIKGLVACMEENDADVVIGSRFLKKNKVPLSRRFFNRVANSFTFLFSWNYITDSQSGIKAINRKGLQTIHIEQDGFGFCSEIVIQAFKHKLKLVETPVGVVYTKESIEKGQSAFVGVRTALNLLQSYLLRH